MRNTVMLKLLLMTLLLTFTITAAGQESCELDSVKIGFQAKTCAFQDYEIILNGEEATGFGNGCISFAEFPNLTNKAWTKLKLNKTYTVTAGTALCITHINFEVPEGYTMYVNGVESTTIFQTNQGQIFSGDGSWDIVVRKKCPCGKEGSGTLDAKQGSVSFAAGLGKLRDGRSAEWITVMEETLSASAYTPSSLVYSPPPKTNEVDLIRNANGSLRQVKAPETLADVVTINASEYELRFYAPANIGAKTGGVYTVTGTPYVTWRIKNPDPTTLTKLEIAKIENGQIKDKVLYTWDPAIDSWTLRTGWTESPESWARIESVSVSYPTSTSRTETTVVKGSDNIVISKFAKTYLMYPWGEELVQEVRDPDGAALTTTYTYYENASEIHRYQKVQSIVYPDGSWEKYDYDVFWNISKIIRPWKDLDMASATESNSHVTLYGYTNSDNGVFGISDFPRIIWDVEEQINGITLRKSRYLRSIAGIDPDMISVTSSSYSESHNLVAVNLIGEAVTTAYRFSAPQFLANRVATVLNADGSKETHSYEQGDFVPNLDPALSAFVPQANGLAERETVVYGTNANPDGVAFKTTKETRVRDQFGNLVLVEDYVYTGSDYERIAWTVNDYNSRGQLTVSRNHKGETTTAVWSGEQKTSEINEAGVETTYTYDLLGQVASETKKGIVAGGGFPAQADIVTSFIYDAEGQVTTQTVTGGGPSLTTTRAYDRAGRLIRETDQAGIQTLYTYSNGGGTQTVTRGGGATEITDKYRDGQTKSITGTSTVARYFDYGVNADGTRFAKEFTGTGGLSSPRWTKTTIDWMNRPIKIERPSFTGVNVIEATIYNLLGQIIKQTTTANGSRLIADQLFEYDALGQQIRKGSDVDNSGTLTAVSTDRFQETDGAFERTGNDWFRVMTARNYLTDNSGTSVTRTQRERLNNFPLNGTDQTVLEITTTDVAGNQSKSTTTVDRAAKKQITTIDTPDSNLNAVNVTVNSLLQSSSASTPQTATTYTYDSLARRTGITDPRTGTTSRTYNATTGQLAGTNDGAGTTTYDYYPATHLNAGRVKSMTNASGKKIYFGYTARGELLQTWGDTTYPLEYVYDNYGQRTELHTFRTGQNWSATAWPATTTGAADVTKWIYQESTGLVTQKQDHALKGPAYTYDELGRLKTRIWARGLTCTYGYDAITGELRTITYTGGTPAVSFSNDRGGRQTNVIDAAGSHTRTFNLTGGLETEQISGGILDGVAITVGYDGFLRRQSLQTTHGVNTLSNQTYGYDATSRLQTVTSGSQTATYAFHANSGLLNTTTFTGGTVTARSYDGIGRLENITTTPAGAAAQSYVFTYNNLNQRTRVTREDGSYWSYGYNDRGELTSGKMYWGDNSVVWGAQTEYNFDNIGNRTSARNGGNQFGVLRQSNYTANSLNQYSHRTVPGALDITGSANTNATVTVNNEGTVRKGEYFYKELAVDNITGPVSQQINVIGARNNSGPGGEDAITQKGGRDFLPQASETFTYDDDGNLLTDGRWIYTWDAENRLLSMEAAVNVPVEAKLRLEFAYDYAGRRLQKKTYAWNETTSSYDLVTTSKFVNDGWNTVVQLDGSNNVQKTFIWGRDNSGSLQGAGGIGGLLLINEAGETHQVGYDGNGNVVALTKASTGTSSASYEYDSFGRSLRVTGEYAASNPFRFSTKYIDSENGHVYFGYRYYNPQTGTWLNRDPLQEDGGFNLYGFVRNNAVSNLDPVGLSHRSDIGIRLDYSCKCGWIDWSHAVADGNGADAKQLWETITSNRGEEESLTKKGYLAMYGQTFDYPLRVGLDGVINSYFVRYNLSKDEQVLVALSIVKEVSEQFEALQAGFPYAWPIRFTNSGFSEEDLVSDLLAINMAIKNVKKNWVAATCRVVKPHLAREIWDRTGGLRQMKTWTPNYYNDVLKGCCQSKAEWPNQLLKMQSIPKGELWRDWTLKLDYYYTLY